MLGLEGVLINVTHLDFQSAKAAQDKGGRFIVVIGLLEGKQVLYMLQMINRSNSIFFRS